MSILIYQLLLSTNNRCIIMYRITHYKQRAIFLFEQESRSKLLNPTFHSCVDLHSSTEISEQSYGYVLKRITSAKSRCDKEKQNSVEFLQMQIKVK